VGAKEEKTYWGATITYTVTIPSSVRWIGEYAFFNTAITAVTLPASVTSLAANAFPRGTIITRLTYQPSASV
jgi:uncharacterized membrane protein